MVKITREVGVGGEAVYRQGKGWRCPEKSHFLTGCTSTRLRRSAKARGWRREMLQAARLTCNYLRHLRHLDDLGDLGHLGNLGDLGDDEEGALHS